MLPFGGDFARKRELEEPSKGAGTEAIAPHRHYFFFLELFAFFGAGFFLAFFAMVVITFQGC